MFKRDGGGMNKFVEVLVGVFVDFFVSALQYGAKGWLKTPI